MHISCASTLLTLPLRPLALWMAFPSALVGRDSDDYYERSVTLALAGCRRSCLPSLLDVSSVT